MEIYCFRIHWPIILFYGEEIESALKYYSDFAAQDYSHVIYLQYFNTYGVLIR
ncbi:MAG: hypothetical protein WCP85_08210 [Mariniphaga sp.]